MSRVEDLPSLIARQALSTVTATAAATTDPPQCESGNDYDGRIGVRISAIFVIWLGSTLGAALPVYLKRRSGVVKKDKLLDNALFIAKYFGSGVIIATAFIHLLSPAHDALTNECLTGPITEYAWVEGIALMAIFALFFAELMTMRYGNFGNDPYQETNGNQISLQPTGSPTAQGGHMPGSDHLGHAREHHDPEENRGRLFDDYASQITALFILEFGIVFHSVFVGLTLAVAGEEFKTLYVVIVFHQTFEGLGLGSRLAVAEWPKDKLWTPYFLALFYGFTTPVAIAIGLGVREAYAPGSKTALIVNGVFDSISAGILIYTGLVELMAHEFMYSPLMRKASMGRYVLPAVGLMCLGAGLMALLGKWA